MRFLWLVFLLSLFVSAKEIILVSILPQSYFAKRVGGDFLDIETLIPPGASPATYSLKPSQLRKIKKASVYFTIGVPFERANLKKILSLNPHLKVVDVGKYIKRQPLHKHQKNASLDPHIWLSPPLVPLIARVMMEQMCKIDPIHTKNYLTNYEKFSQEVIALDRRIYQLLLPLKKRSFIVYHPSFGYFAKAYGLQQIAVEREGKEPTPRYLQRVIKIAKAKGIKTIFVAPQFPKRSALFLAHKIGGKVVSIDPLAFDWETNIQKVARSIAKSD